ncbi:CASP-like protein 1U1 [Miscanthus floridulus]|uniref:CASP-like protein 1U1 n=1 Tax=Miscanthus floridulus TaxID=154761 RepID=UPI003458FAE6
MAEEVYKALSLLFRIAALGLSVAAAVVMGTASQLVIIDGSPESSSYSASYSQYNALRYFVAAGAISAVCSAAALYLFAVRADAAVASLPLVPVLDAAAQGFLFSAAGAAFATRDVVGGTGTAAGSWGSNAGGGSVCDSAGAFCGRVIVAAAACAFAAVSAAVAALARDASDGTSGGRRCDW